MSQVFSRKFVTLVSLKVSSGCTRARHILCGVTVCDQVLRTLNLSRFAVIVLELSLDFATDGSKSCTLLPLSSRFLCYSDGSRSVFEIARCSE